jgi:hypothetical protein
VAGDEVAGRLVVAIEQLAARSTARSAEPAPTTTGGGLPPGHARISMIYAIRHRQAVADVVAELNLTTIRESEATMTGTQSFRGSSREVQKPALQIDVDVPELQEPAV